MSLRYLLVGLLLLLMAAPIALAQNWRLLAPPETPKPDLYGVAFYNRDSGFVCGVRGGVGRLYATTDAGSSWRAITLPGTPGALTDLRLIEPSGSVAVAGEDGYVAISDDQGKSWSLRSIPTTVWPSESNINSVLFRDRMTGFAVGSPRLGSGPRLARTSNGGLTWINVAQTGAANNLYALDFFDALNGEVVGTGLPPRTSLSTDAGVNWQPDATMQLTGPPVTTSLSFYDIDAVTGTSTAFSSGGKVFASPQYPEVRRTTDMGRSWSPTSMSGALSGFRRPASNLLAVGDQLLFVSARGGNLYRSADAGQSWTTEQLPSGVGTRDLRRMAFLMDNRANNQIYLVGLGGIILYNPLPIIKTLQINAGNRDAGSLRVDPNLSQPLTLSNVITSTGDSPVLVSRVSLARGTDFTLISPTTPQNLAPGQMLTIILDFQPKAPCIRRDTVIIEHDGTAPSSPIRIPIQGTGLVPTFSTRPFDTLDFGGVLVGQPRNDTLRLDNIQVGGCLDTTLLDTLRILGPQQAEFGALIVIRKGTRIAPQGSISVPMRAVPSAAGRRIAYAVIFHEIRDASPDTVVLVVNGLKPELTTVQSLVKFAATDLGGRRDSTLVDFLQNLSNSAVTIDSVRLLGTNPGDFLFTGPSTPFDIVISPRPGFKRTINLSFVPTGLGTREAILRLMTSAGTKEVVLQGNAERSIGEVRIQQVIFTPSTPVNLCADTTINAVIYNRGNVPLRVTTIRVGAQTGSPSADDSLAFTVIAPVIPPELVIKPGDSAAVTVRFCPKHPGPYQARLLLVNNSATDTFSLGLTGIGKTTTVITTDSIVFRPTRVLTTIDSTLKAFIANRGGGLLVIDSMSISGADANSFTVIGPPTPFSVAALRDTSVTIRFNPQRRDRHFAFLNVYHTQGRQTIVLLGQSTYPFLEIRPEDASSLRVRVGASRRLRINVINTGDDSAQIAGVTLSGSSSFSNTSTVTLPARLLPGDTLPVSVDFTPDVICEHLVQIEVRGEGVSGIYRLADTTVRFAGIGTAVMVGSRQPDINFGPRPIGSTNDSVTTDFLGNINFQQDVTRCLDSSTIDSMVIVGRDQTSFSILLPTDPLQPRAAPPGGFHQLTIRFKPVGAGLKEADLLVYFDHRIDSVHRIHLIGAASSLPVEYNPIELNFGKLRLGWERDTMFTVTNASISSVTLNDIHLQDTTEFTILSPTAPVVLSPGVPVEFRVRFAPTAAFGNRQTFLVLRSGQDADSSFRLIGEGVGSTFTVRPDSLNFGTRLPGPPVGLAVALLQLASPSVPLPLLDSVIIDRAEIVQGSPAFVVASVPGSVQAGGVDSLRIQFIPAGAAGTRTGRARIYFDRHQAGGVANLLDSTDIILTGKVDGTSFLVTLDIGSDIAASPGEIVAIPITLLGDVSGAAFDTLNIDIGFRRTMLQAESATSAQSGVVARLITPTDVPGTSGRLRVNLIAASNFTSGKVAELRMRVLLGDTLESVIRVDSAGMASRPDIIVARDSIRFSVDRFCDAQGRLLRFDSALSITTTPNPASKRVLLSWHLPATVRVQLSIFDSRGNEIRRLADGLTESGNYQTTVDLSTLPSGTYHCQLVAGRFTKTLTLQILE